MRAVGGNVASACSCSDVGSRNGNYSVRLSAIMHSRCLTDTGPYYYPKHSHVRTPQDVVTYLTAPQISRSLRMKCWIHEGMVEWRVLYKDELFNL